MRETTNGTRRDLYALRTVLSAAFGALAAAVVTFFAVAGLLAEGGPQDLAALGIGLIAAAIGSVAGAAGAVALALRHARGRRVTVVTVLVGGLPLSALGVAGVLWLIDQLGFYPDPRVAILLATVVFLPATALLGRWLATRKHPDGGDEP